VQKIVHICTSGFAFGLQTARRIKKNQYEINIRNYQKHYVVDKILIDHGHEVLRLPPYYCQYNPIALAWGLSTNYYNKHINEKLSSRNKVADLWLESILKCTPEIWQNYCMHCEELIASAWTKHMGNFSVANIPPFIISCADSDSESGSDFDDSDYLITI
jgi:hypothetical protein